MRGLRGLGGDLPRWLEQASKNEFFVALLRLIEFPSRIKSSYMGRLAEKSFQVSGYANNHLIDYSRTLTYIAAFPSRNLDIREYIWLLNNLLLYLLFQVRISPTYLHNKFS